MHVMTIRNLVWTGNAVVGFTWFLVLGATGPLQAAPPGEAELGRRIFERNWARPDELDDVLGEGGDGLGPLFNDVSCAACHGQAGSGGSGPNERNAMLLSIVDEVPKGRRARVSRANRAKSVHFEFAETTTVVLHKFGIGPDDAPYEYDEWRVNLLTPAEQAIESGEVTPVQFRTRGMKLELAQRNTPALWGLGIIEKSAGFVKASRTACSVFREEFRDRQQSETPWITGRIPRTGDGREGWFGWRGQTATLEEFVLNACSHELGLEVPGHSQPDSPVVSAEQRRLDARDLRLDLTRDQCRALTAFVEDLPRPQQVLPETADELAMVRAGELAFERAGCTHCHVPDFSGITGFYSDMLLHDMGESLSDSASAHPELERGVRSTGRGGYSGGSSTSLARTRSLPCDCQREWKTPPLWGVADSAPYLHDGRAATLEEAILLHDGEASTARYAWEILPKAEQSNLLAFLESLRAPLE
jgi:CxxC motif-containing protein (DUF1111 family)